MGTLAVRFKKAASFISLAFILSGCFDEVVYLDQNWNEDNQLRTLSYTTSQGSQLIPYDWFINLKDAKTGLPLTSDIVVERLKYLPDYQADSNTNPDKLPIGFVKDTDPETGDWIGINCAACHTAQIVVGNTAIRIDGGPGMGDYIAMIQTVKNAIDNTLAKPRLFKKFANAIGADDSNSLASAMATQSEALASYIRNDSSIDHPGGFGRVDAANAIRNEIFVSDLGVDTNYLTPAAPVSYPALWGAPDFERVQYLGYARNPFGRNLGQVLGVLGRINLQNPENLFESTVRRDNLFYMEEWLRELGSPEWPTEYLGDIDNTAASRGAEIYQTPDVTGYACVNCHVLPDSQGNYPKTPAQDNLFGMQFTQTPLIPIEKLGTDTNALTTFYNPEPINMGMLGLLGLDGVSQEMSYPLALIKVVEFAVGKQYLSAPALNQTQQAVYSGLRVDSATAPEFDLYPGYLARPLAGVWATSPYLHNGSVPNLYELLLPPEQRSDEFYVGSFEFDPEKVGYVSTYSYNTFKFDTSVSGNSNSGHYFGTFLSDEERWDLIEYLKTL